MCRNRTPNALGKFGTIRLEIAIDRLGCSIGDLPDIVRTVRSRAGRLRDTKQPIDASTAAGKCYLDMLGSLAGLKTTLPIVGIRTRKFARQDILLVLDGAPNHRCGVLVVPDNITLLYLPPYTPQLNPNENIWDEIREKIFKN